LVLDCGSYNYDEQNDLERFMVSLVKAVRGYIASTNARAVAYLPTA